MVAKTLDVGVFWHFDVGSMKQDSETLVSAVWSFVSYGIIRRRIKLSETHQVLVSS